MNLRSILLIILIGFIAYFPSLFGQFVWDDEDFVFENTYVATHQYSKFFTEQAIAGRGKLSNYYRPIQMSVYALIHQLFGFNPVIYHAVNIIIHIAAALALLWFITELTVSHVPRDLSFIARVKRDAKEEALAKWGLLPSLIFLIHPIQTEAVSYVSGLSDPFVALFGFFSLAFFIQSGKQPLFLLLSLLSFILALLSKEIGLAFFGVLVLLVLLKKRPLISLLPFFLSSVIYLLFHLQVINVLDMSKVWGSTPYATSISIRIATFIQNIFFSLGLFFFPKDLHMERDLTTSIQLSLFNPFTIAFIVLCSIAIIYFWIKRNEEKASLQFFALAGFFTTLLPYSGIVLINGIFYEHYMYIPIIFLSLFLMLTIQMSVHNVTKLLSFEAICRELFKIHPSSLRDPARWRGAAIFTKRSYIAIFILMCTILIARSYARQYDWIDSVRFYTQTLSFAPESLRIRNGLGMAYMDIKAYDKALATFDEVIARDPLLPNSYHNKGNIFFAQGKFDEAEQMYKKAIEVDPSFTFSIVALNNLYRKSNQPEKLTELKKLYSNILNSKY